MWRGDGTAPVLTAEAFARTFTPELDGTAVQPRLRDELAACGSPRPPRAQQPLAAHPVLRGNTNNNSSNDSAKSFHTGVEQPQQRT